MRLPSREQNKMPLILIDPIRSPLSMSPCVKDENEAMRRMVIRKVEWEMSSFFSYDILCLSVFQRMS